MERFFAVQMPLIHLYFHRFGLKQRRIKRFHVPLSHLSVYVKGQRHRNIPLTGRGENRSRKIER